MASIYGEYVKRSRLRLDYSYTQSIANNQTTFTISLYAEKPSGMGTHNYGYHDSTYTVSGKSGSQLINGTGDWTWGNTTEYKIADSTYIYTHNSDGSGSCTLSGSWITGLTSSSVVGNSMSVSGTISLPSIPRQANITRCDNFNSDWNPYMEFNNPGGFTCNLRLEFAGTTISRNGYTGYGGGYTFQLTNAERQLLYSKCSTSNSLTVRYVVATLINGTETWWSYYDRTMYVVQSNPTFSNFRYEDTGGISTQLTGDNQIIINNFNVTHIIIPVANKAIAKNGASMVKYRAVCGNIADEKNYSSNSDVILELPYIKNKTISVYATDSRGNSTLVSITIDSFNWKNYIDPTVSNASIARQNGVGTTTTLSFSGKIWKTQDVYDFGAVANEIVTCNYKFKKTSESEYGNPINITPTIDSNGNYNFNSTITGDIAASGFSLTDSFNVQITIEDKIRTITYNLLLGAGSPAMAIHKNGVAFGAPYNTNEGGPLQVYGKSINTYSTNEVIVGTWINGKPLYRKVIDCGYLLNADVKEVPTGTTDVTMIKMEGVIYPPTGNQSTFPYNNPSTGVYGFFNKSGNKLRIATLSDRSTNTCLIYFYYIKDND